jgi:hypothetical protein
MKNHLIGIIFLLTTFTACQFFQEDKPEDRVIARVKDKYLYFRDVSSLLKKTNHNDSLRIVNYFIDNWIKRQLLYLEAEEKAEIDKAELERRVEEYRYQLLVYAYQKKYIDQHLDTLVTDSEIESYYQAHQQNFELKQPIVRAIYAKIPVDAPRIDEMRKKLLSNNSDDLEEFKSYCFTYSHQSYTYDSVWRSFDETVAGTPFMGITDAVQFLPKTKFLEEKDESYWYFLRIFEYKLADQVSPIGYVREQIVNTILHQRKTLLQKQHEEAVMLKAKKNSEIEIIR